MVTQTSTEIRLGHREICTDRWHNKPHIERDRQLMRRNKLATNANLFDVGTIIKKKNAECPVSTVTLCRLIKLANFNRLHDVYFWVLYYILIIIIDRSFVFCIDECCVQPPTIGKPENGTTFGRVARKSYLTWFVMALAQMECALIGTNSKNSLILIDSFEWVHLIPNFKCFPDISVYGQDERILGLVIYVLRISFLHSRI